LGRSESESAFDEKRVRRARNNSVGLAYLSPQNKSLAQSFRYMRTKPTIIAFKTPSMEEREHQVAAGEANGASPASRAEQGQLSSRMDSADKLQLARLSLSAEGASKPLEVSTRLTDLPINSSKPLIASTEGPNTDGIA